MMPPAPTPTRYTISYHRNVLGGPAAKHSDPRAVSYEISNFHPWRLRSLSVFIGSILVLFLVRLHQLWAWSIVNFPNSAKRRSRPHLRILTNWRNSSGTPQKLVGYHSHRSAALVRFLDLFVAGYFRSWRPITQHFRCWGYSGRD